MAYTLIMRDKIYCFLLFFHYFITFLFLSISASTFLFTIIAFNFKDNVTYNYIKEHFKCVIISNLTIIFFYNLLYNFFLYNIILYFKVSFCKI